VPYAKVECVVFENGRLGGGTGVICSKQEAGGKVTSTLRSSKDLGGMGEGRKEDATTPSLQATILSCSGEGGDRYAGGMEAGMSSNLFSLQRTPCH